MGSVPTIDLGPWFGGTPDGRRSVATAVDDALQSVGFFLLTGPGVTREQRARIRSAARAFFALPPEVKQSYAVTVGGRGWLPPGVEANGYSEGTDTPPDMNAPYDPDAFTINTGDLLARWSGDRWKSNRHRVLPPQAEAPDEDLVSLVFFYEADWDAMIFSLQPQLGKANSYEPVMASDFRRRLLDATTVG